MDLNSTIARIDTRLDSIDVTLAKQAKDIEHHIQRTDDLQMLLQLAQNEMKPLKNTHREIIGVLKFLGFISVLIAIYTGAKAIFS